MLFLALTVFLLAVADQLARGISLDTYPVPAEEDGEFQRAAITDQQVVLISEQYLYFLSPSLALQRRERVSGTPIRLLFAASNSPPGDERLLLCDLDCFVIDSDYLIEWPSPNGVNDVPRVLDVSTDGQDVRIFTGTFQRGSGPGRYDLTYAQNGGERDDNAVASRMVRGTLIRAARENPEERPDRFEISASQVETNPSQERVFIHSFTRNGFTYFVSILLFQSGFQTTVSRLCDSDMGRENGAEGDFTSYIELVLQCGDNTGEPSAATFIPSPNAFDADTLVLSVGITRLSEVRNRLCAFNVSLIDQMMAEKIDQCANGVGMMGLKRNSVSRKECRTHRVRISLH